MDARNIIVRPVVSEKSYALIAEGKYTFSVNERAHKTQISPAVAEIFGVQVVKVRTSKVRPSRSGAACTGPDPRPGRRRSSSWRRASGSSCSRAPRPRRDRDAEPQDKTNQPGAPLRDLPAARAAHRDRAGAQADRGPAQVRRAQRQRPGHRPPSRRRRQAPLPPDRLQAPQGRRARQGGDDRVRPEPQLLHRPAPLRRRRQELHPRPGAAARSATRSSPAPAPTSSRATRWRCARCRPARSSTTSS